jgi:hypothetical protein
VQPDLQADLQADMQVRLIGHAHADFA